MTIEQIITQWGSWGANPTGSLLFMEQILQQVQPDGLEDFYQQKEYHKNRLEDKQTGVRFLFEEIDNSYVQYGDTPYGQAIFAKLFFRVDEEEGNIKLYEDENCKSEVVLQFNVMLSSETQIAFYAIEADMHFFCEFDADTNKLPRKD